MEMEYGKFISTVKEKFCADSWQETKEKLSLIPPGERALAITALNYGFTLTEILEASRDSRREQNLSSLVRQKMDDNTSEIQA